MTGKPIDLFVADGPIVGYARPKGRWRPRRSVGWRTGAADGEDLHSSMNARRRQAVVAGRVRRSQYRFTVFTRDQRIQQYQGRLKANNIERTSVLSLSCQDVLPSRQAFLDTLAAFIDYGRARLATNLQTGVHLGQLAEINALTPWNAKWILPGQNQVLDLSREQAEIHH